jgi:hypothetical protein
MPINNAIRICVIVILFGRDPRRDMLVYQKNLKYSFCILIILYNKQENFQASKNQTRMIPRLHFLFRNLFFGFLLAIAAATLIIGAGTIPFGIAPLASAILGHQYPSHGNWQPSHSLLWHGHPAGGCIASLSIFLPHNLLIY